MSAVGGGWKMERCRKYGGGVIWNLALQVLKEIGNWEMGYVLRPPGTSKGFNRE